MTPILKIYTQERATYAARSAQIDTIVVHLTDTPGLKRFSTDKAYNLQRIEAARSFGGISGATADALKTYYSDGRPMSDAVILALINASNAREAAPHYWVASMPLPGQSWVEVVEFIDPRYSAHHVGDATQPTNQRSVGIENLYPGVLPASTTLEAAWAKYRGWGWPDQPYKAKAADGATYWYTPVHPVAYRGLVDLCRKLVGSYPLIKTGQGIQPHSKFAPSSRIDPDPPISLEQLRKDTFAATAGAGMSILAFGAVVGVIL